MNSVWIDFREVKQSVPMPDVLEVFGLVGQFRHQGRVLVGRCPLPDHRHGPRPNDQQFKISHKDGIWQWYCFGDCKRGGSVVDFVQAMTGYSLAHTRLWFAEHFGDRLTTAKPNQCEASLAEATTNEARDESGYASESPQAPVPKDVVADSPPPVKKLKPLRFRLNLDSRASYLQQRGLTERTVAHFGCGLAKRGILDGYVCWPIYRWPRHDQMENPLGYVGRWPGDDFNEAPRRPRYKIPTGFPVSRCVHGLAEAMESTPASTPLVVVEGVFKAAWLWQCGVAGAVSTLTANVSQEQSNLLFATQRPIVLCFDGTKDALDAMGTAARKLQTNAFVRLVKLDPGVEPDDLSPEQVRDIFSFLF